MDSYDANHPDAQEAGHDSRLSYKFQRLRERLRQAIDSGELQGKLPGERQLSRRFRVNAKTLSKALTDLAAEGVLERSIGRGTFVRGHGVEHVAEDKWLLICDPEQIDSPFVQAISKANPGAQIAIDVTSMRPSFINQFKAVVDFAVNTPDTFLRDLIVRNIALVAVGREARVYSSHAVLVDRPLGVSLLARDMMLAGHTRFFAIERVGQTQVKEIIRRTAARYAPESVVDSGDPKETAAALQHGVTAFICDSRQSAEQTREALERLNVNIPETVSIGAVGSGWGEYPCSGYFVDAAEKTEAILELIRDKSSHRPVTLWLTGKYTERGTIASRRAEITTPQLTLSPRLNSVSV